ncbi:hypothetical protein [Anaeroselena agilis]|uniref:Uncharacterized protein n=1 Tax=Anaeroselena agilis TaxID=3063788 RepID=A0ABU3P208_9FIRM|nr:hypothetical protein [Selenomonadales bacterium 4137-cl]
MEKWRVGLAAFLVILLAGLGAGQAWGAAAPDAAQPVEQWVGKVFVVLPLERGKKAEGYAFTLEAPRPELFTAGGNIRADWLEGKRLEVVTVKKLPALKDGPPVNDYEIFFRIQGGGEGLTIKALGGQAKHLVPADDLAAAKKHFAAKVVFSKRLAIPAYQEEPGTIRVKINEPLTVEDVIAGIDADEPIWLVVSTADKRKGYIAIAYSLTNVQRGFWPTAKPWESVLFETDPRLLFAWDDQAWASINAGVVKDGMVPDQVRLAWGEPLSIVRLVGEETWFYPDKIVKFHPTTGLFLIQSR